MLPAAPAAIAPPTDTVTLSAAAAPPPEKTSWGRKVGVTLALILAGGGIVAGIVPHLGSPTPTTVSAPAPAKPVAAPAQPAVSAPIAAAVIQGRAGEILGSGKMLKADQFPALQNASLPLRIAGAPNFRQLKSEPVYGVAQPTIDGIRNVLRQVGAGPGGRGPAALWTSLREEPVVYVNGRPFNPRVATQPFANLEFPGSSTTDTEARDARLKQDVLREAALHGGSLLIHEEGADGQVTARFEKIASVQTPAEVYAGLRAEGFRVDYARIPVSDEKGEPSATVLGSE